MLSPVAARALLMPKALRREAKAKASRKVRVVFLRQEYTGYKNDKNDMDYMDCTDYTDCMDYLDYMYYM